MSIRRRIADKQHRWLSQVEMTGIVLSEPVLAESAPAGFRDLEKRELAKFYKAREIWNLPAGMVSGDPDDLWAEFVLEQLLCLAPNRWQIGASIASHYTVTLAQQREVLRPTRVLVDAPGALLLYLRVPRHQSLDSPWSTGGSWKASPTTKLERLLRESSVEIGLVTNGEAWRLLVASPAETAAWLTWTAQTWADSPSTLSAFVDLLGEARFYAGPRPGVILELIRASRKRQADVADQLGTQVREALALFVRELDRIDAAESGMFEKSYSDGEIFDAAASLVMRLVFLLKAEEAGLLPHGMIAYDRSYGVLHLLTRLEQAHRLGPERLRQSNEAYAQLLATFRLVHDGSSDPDINVTAYGGELFDPEEYPLLEGRFPDGQWPERRQLRPLPVRDSVVRDMLRCLKYARGDSGSVQWVSYRALEIEQLGHMYEGLLDLKLQRAPESSGLLLLTPTEKAPSPTITLSELIVDSPASLCEPLSRATGRSIDEITRLIERAQQKQLEHGHDSRLPEDLPSALACIARLVRPGGVVRAHGLHVDYGNRRHDQGAVYTPVSITEPMVRRTLEPLVLFQDGPQRRLRSAREILALRVCDPAMGSAAFLVQGVRFLAERLVDAWDEATAADPSVSLTMPYAAEPEGEAGELLMPDSREERVLWARRFVVERCIYGVDINPLAVEMAKLSLWLTTAAPDRPFTFLNHVLRCGNSVVGVDLVQLRTWSLDRKGKDNSLLVELLSGTIDTAVATRHALARLTGRATDADRRRALRKADDAMGRLTTAANLLVAPWLAAGDDKARAGRVTENLSVVTSARTNSDWAAIATNVRKLLGDVEPFHWPCYFPDVFIEREGFDAVIGNPPYVRQEILTPIKPLLKRGFESFDSGADLYVYFYELGLRILRPGGRLSLVVTNKWMKAGYGEKLRKKFAASAWVESIVDFGHAKQLFKDVDVFPSILLVSRPIESIAPPPKTRVCVIDRRQLRLDDLDGQIDREGYDIPRDSLTSEAWMLETPAVRALMDKLVDRGVRLASYVGASPQYGVKTGLNEAFVIEENQRRRITDSHPGASALFVKLLRGRDLKRWHVEWGGQWLLLLKSSENANHAWSDRGAGAEAVFRKTYPSVYEHLLPLKERLEGRADMGRFWWELRSCAYYAAFEQPKILYQEIQYSPRFALDDEGFVSNNKTFFISSGDPVLLAVLNSPLMWWYAWRVLGHMKDDALNPATFKMDELPIPALAEGPRSVVAGTVAEMRTFRAKERSLWAPLLALLEKRWPDCASGLAGGGRRKGGAGLKAAFKKFIAREGHPTKTELRDLTGLADTALSAAGVLGEAARVVERRLSDLVFDAFALSAEERALVWETAPPRTPLAGGGGEDEDPSGQDDE